MSDLSAVELLREALALLRRVPAITSSDACARENHALAARIDQFLTRSGDRKADEALLREARERWKDEPGIRVDEAALFSADAQGLWIRGWLHVSEPRAPLDRDAYDVALGRLPVLAREVFLLNRRDGLDYAIIGQRLGLSTVEVEQQFSTALSTLHRQVYGVGR